MTLLYGDYVRITDMQAYEEWFGALPADQSGDANIEFNGNPLRVVRKPDEVLGETCVKVEWEYKPRQTAFVCTAWIPVRFLEIDPEIIIGTPL